MLRMIRRLVKRAQVCAQKQVNVDKTMQNMLQENLDQCQFI